MAFVQPDANNVHYTTPKACDGLDRMKEKPWELRCGRIIGTCNCIRRNGLQSECYRSDCVNNMKSQPVPANDQQPPAPSAVPLTKDQLLLPQSSIRQRAGAQYGQIPQVPSKVNLLEPNVGNPGNLLPPVERKPRPPLAKNMQEHIESVSETNQQTNFRSPRTKENPQQQAIAENILRAHAQFNHQQYLQNKAKNEPQIQRTSIDEDLGFPPQRIPVRKQPVPTNLALSNMSPGNYQSNEPAINQQEVPQNINRPSVTSNAEQLQYENTIPPQQQQMMQGSYGQQAVYPQSGRLPNNYQRNEPISPHSQPAYQQSNPQNQQYYPPQQNLSNDNHQQQFVDQYKQNQQQYRQNQYNQQQSQLNFDQQGDSQQIQQFENVQNQPNMAENELQSPRVQQSNVPKSPPGGTLSVNESVPPAVRGSQPGTPRMAAGGQYQQVVPPHTIPQQQPPVIEQIPPTNQYYNASNATSVSEPEYNQSAAMMQQNVPQQNTVRQNMSQPITSYQNTSQPPTPHQNTSQPTTPHQHMPQPTIAYQNMPQPTTPHQNMPQPPIPQHQLIPQPSSPHQNMAAQYQEMAPEYQYQQNQPAMQQSMQPPSQAVHQDLYGSNEQNPHTYYSYSQNQQQNGASTYMLAQPVDISGYPPQKVNQYGQGEMYGKGYQFYPQQSLYKSGQSDQNYEQQPPPAQQYLHQHHGQGEFVTM